MDIVDVDMPDKDIRKKYLGDCCGNSFVIFDCLNCDLDKKFKSELASSSIIKYGVDSALFIKKSAGMDAFMEIFEKDGSESDSCGNGTILVAHLLGLNNGKIEMKDNAAMIMGDTEKQAILMSMKFSSAKKINGYENCFFARVGEPHIVCLVDDLNKFDLDSMGRKTQKEYPDGVNVNAIQKIDETHYLIRTYERGVFAETKSCGTGSLSSYLVISNFYDKMCEEPIEFKSDGGVHWVSRHGNLLKLETLKKFCQIKEF